VGKGLSVVVGMLESVGRPVPVPLGLGEEEHVAEGVGLGEAEVLGLGDVLGLADALEVGDALGLGDALEVGAQLDVSAAATPPNGPVKTTTATEISRTAAPAARPASPARCSFSQLIRRDRRKIVTTPWLVKLVRLGSQPPR
jgi:hypothetical protein